MNNDLLVHSGILFLAALGGGLIIIVRRWSDELLHHFLSFGAGVFLGIVFLHLLPETFHIEHHWAVGFFVLGGFLLLFFVERFLFTRGDRGYEHSHQVLGHTAFIGLSVHALMDGLGLAVTVNNTQLGSLIFYSILVHKVPAAFALASLLILAKLPVRKIAVFLALFAAMTPVGALLLSPLFLNGKQDILTLMTGLVTGSFLYISTGELLPEALHSRRRRWLNLGLMLLGIIVVCWFTAGENYDFGH